MISQKPGNHGTGNCNCNGVSSMQTSPMPLKYEIIELEQMRGSHQFSHYNFASAMRLLNSIKRKHTHTHAEKKQQNITT